MSTPPIVVSSRAQPTTGGVGPKTPALADANPDVLTFVNRRATITVPIASCKLERTIEGASSLTVTVHDPALSFLNSEAIQGPKHGELESFVVLENLVFALAGVHLLKGHMVEVILEDEAIHRLRKNTKALTMKRGSVTRAEFIKHMFAESGVPLISKELHKKQPIKKAETRSEKDKSHKPGLSDHAKLTVKSQPIDSDQRASLEIALAQAVTDNAGPLATLALIVGGIGESTFHKGESTQSQNGAQVGVWQSDVIPADRVAEQAHYFLIGGKSFGAGGAIHLAKTQPSLTPGDIATQVEVSGQPGEFYNVYHAEAEKIVNAFTGGDAGALQNDKTYIKPYQYERKGGEDSWAAAQRLAKEVGWYLFVVDGVAHFESGKSLKAGRALMLVAPAADGLIANPTFGYWTTHQYDDTVTVECHASKWGAPPGSIAEVEGYGPAGGRWIVTAITREQMKSSVTTITLGRGKEPTKEPAHELGTRPTSTGGASGVAGYVNPLAKITGLGKSRIDMGVDYYGSGDVLAMGDCEVTYSAAVDNGWEGGGAVVYKLLGGAYAGKHIYFAERFRPTVKVGDRLKAGAKIGTMFGGSIETGWATGLGSSTIAASLGQQGTGDAGEVESPAGASFNRFLVACGAPPGNKNTGGLSKRGHPMPAGYP
jgi:hypothetical protein